MQVISKYNKETRLLKIFKGSLLISRLIERSRPLSLMLYGHLGEIEFLKGVSDSVVRISDVHNYDKLLKGIRHAINLESLSITFKNKDPFEFDCLPRLNYLEVFNTNSKSQVKTILTHESLKRLLIREFKDSIFEENNTLESLYISGSFSDFRSFGEFKSLKEVTCVRGTALKSLDGLPKNIQNIELDMCKGISSFEHLSNLTNVEKLTIKSSGSIFPVEVYSAESLSHLALLNGPYFKVDWERLFSLPKIERISINSKDVPSESKLLEMAKRNKRCLEKISHAGTKINPAIYITFNSL